MFKFIDKYFIEDAVKEEYRMLEITKRGLEDRAAVIWRSTNNRDCFHLRGRVPIAVKMGEIVSLRGNRIQAIRENGDAIIASGKSWLIYSQN